MEVGFSRTHCVIASVSEAIEHVGLFDMVACHARPTGSLAMTKGVRLKSHLRIPRKSARKAMAKPQHSAALDSAIFDSSLLMILFSQPQRARLCSHINIDEALWSMT